MATILDVAAQGLIQKLDPVLRSRQQEQRLFYLFPRFRERVEARVTNMQSLFESEISPLEQLDDLLNQYCAGEPLLYERQFHPLRHIEDGVWELKTPDLRLFGWFYRRDCFVCSTVDDATAVKRHQLYGAYCSEVTRDRDNLPLNEPKFVPGDNPNDVISNIHYPPS